MRAIKILSTLGVVLLALSALSAVGLAQEMENLPQASDLARQSLRPYWHVFAAYTIAIVLIGGWAVSIARRLRAVEERLLD
ncbi:MAG: hypothetical protein OEO79_16195 [Gemmatimonadota bacterium]|nr:hypothetical protein [Gemmatimonadota bacterium]